MGGAGNARFLNGGAIASAVAASICCFGAQVSNFNYNKNN